MPYVTYMFCIIHVCKQVAAQWEEEGWVDPASFAEIPEDQELLQKVEVTLISTRETVTCCVSRPT